MPSPEQRAQKAAYQREWRKRRKAQGFPVDQRTPEARKRRRDGQAEYLREYRARRKVEEPGWQPAKGERTPEAHRAQEAVRRAIRSGRLVRPPECERCGSSGPIEAAHHDYEKRLEVQWLCRPCHRRWDFEEPKSCRP